MARAYAETLVSNTQSYLRGRIETEQRLVRDHALERDISTDAMVRINSWLEEVRALIERGPEGCTEWVATTEGIEERTK